MMSGSSQFSRRLIGKVAIVTASTKGIGYAIARRLGQEGASVMVSSRKVENVQRAVERLQAENLDVKGMVCHVGKSDHRFSLINDTVKTFGRLDVLVSNAAVNPQAGNIFDSTEEQWDKILDINIKSAFLLVKEAIPHLEKTRGSVIFTGSVAGYVPFELISLYSIVKTALLGLTKNLSLACAEKNVRVNCLAPGLIKTDFSKALWESDKSEEFMKTILLKRFGEPDDVAGAAAFLASDDASYITGETIVIAGGMPSHL